jgi:2-oxoglutarate ferredoxin oxidoreductase subunit beta
LAAQEKNPHNVKVNGVHTLHGRMLPFAMGIVANPDLEVQHRRRR